MQLDGIRFGIWESEDVVRRSVVEIVHGRSFSNGKVVSGGPFDERLGTWRNLYDKCKTCGESGKKCHGHFGHFKLPEAIIHPLFLKTVSSLLEKYCFSCYKLHNAKLTCPKCSCIYSVLHGTSKQCIACGFDKVSYTKCGYCGATKCKWQLKEDGSFSASRLKGNFSLVSRESFFTFLSHVKEAKRFVMSVLPIPPSIIRPPNITSGETVRGQSDMTLNIVEIIKLSNELRLHKESLDLEHVLNEIRGRLFVQISMYISNSSTSTSEHFKKNSGNLQGILDRLKGKQGRFRLNLMGKRSNYTARTVVSGDASLGIEEIGVPISVANTLTKPVRITSYNVAHWNDVLRKYPDTIKCIEDGDGMSVNLDYVSKSSMQLFNGNLIHRVLQDGDWVLFNRQPSLHKQSLMAHRIRVLPFSSFRMNLSATSPYNADFDGDEMNIHVPQTLLATTDLVFICAVARQFISKTSNSPIMGIVQDTLLTTYRATRHDLALSKLVWNSVMSRLDNKYCDRASDIEKYKNTRTHTGKDLVSLLLPVDFHYKRGEVCIEHGILIKGVLTKKDLGASSGSIIHLLVNDYGGQRAATFIDELQCVMIVYMTHNGFSVGLSDCLLPKKALELIREANEKTDDNLYKLLKKVGAERGDIFEQRANLILNKNRDTTGRIALQYTGLENRFTNMTDSGSKGSTINISQIMACVGQQNVNGKRIVSRLHGRTLPQFDIGDRGADACGYVRHSYVEGLDPHEFFFHTMAGREGLVDTAIKTAGTGYLQRRLVKGMENIQVEYDGSARDVEKIIQFQYGEDGLDSEYIEMQSLDFLLLKENEFRDNFDGGKNSEELEEIKKSIRMFESMDMVRDSNCRFDRRFPLALPLHRLIAKSLRMHLNTMPFKSIEDLYEGQPLTKLHLRWRVYIPAYKAFLTATLASKRLVAYKFNAKQLSQLIIDIRKGWQKAQCIPGEGVGAVAAQSVGEPATQLTLNTFHHAGVSAKNVTLGVPRLTELINCSSVQKTPQTTIFFKTPLNQNLQSILNLRKNIAPVKMSHVVDKYIFKYYQKCPSYSTFDLFPDAGINTVVGGIFAEICIDRVKCEQFGLTLSDIATAMYTLLKRKSPRIIYPVDTDVEHSVIYISIGKQIQELFDGEIYCHHTYKELYDTVKTLVSSAYIGGIDGITTAIVARSKRKTYKKGSLAVDSEWVMYVGGSQLRNVCQMSVVDDTRTFSNDVRDMREMFGIEMARRSMKNEIRKVLQFDGSYLNIRHVSLLVDWMCYQGRLIPFTRFGLSQMSNSVLKLASFERVLHFITNGAKDETYDDCHGASEKIILGDVVRVGTGKIDCFLDVEKCKHAIVAKVENCWKDEMGIPLQNTRNLPEFNWNVGFDPSSSLSPPSPLRIPPPPPPHMPPVRSMPATDNARSRPLSPAYQPMSP